MSTIYLVEDDPFVGRVYERAFRLSGHEVSIRIDGEEAWRGLDEATTLPEVIILDITLPKMNGVDLLKKISGDKRFEAVPLVVLTNSFSDSLEKELKEAGADLFLLKIEHEPKDVVARVVELIQKFKSGV